MKNDNNDYYRDDLHRFSLYCFGRDHCKHSAFYQTQEVKHTRKDHSMKIKQEKIDTIKKMSKYDLLKLFGEYSIKFKPDDKDFMETFEVITNEILSRMTDVV